MLFNGNMFTYSMLLSREYNMENITAEDVKNMLNPDVGDCQIELYLKIIKMLSSGVSYEEIFEFIDLYSSEDYENLLEDQKTYIKTLARKDLLKRKKSLEKGEI